MKIGIISFIALAVIILFAVWFWQDPGSDTAVGPVVQQPSPSVPDVLSDNDYSQPLSRPEPARIRTTETTIADESAYEMPILGQPIRVRELREAQAGSAEAPLRNLEFLFSPRINPKKLFENNNNLIIKYDQFYLNNVGSGASAAFMYYEVITADTDGDGELSELDKRNVAVSLPDASDYTVLVSGIDEVLEYEHSPTEHQLNLMFLAGGRQIKRIYSLIDKQLQHEEILQ